MNMFDIWARHTIHMDFAQYNNNQYLFVVDRLTGYIQAEKVPNQQTSTAIMGVRKWAAKCGLTYKIISDSGGGLRDDFINQLEKLGNDHKPSSANHPASNSLAERTVQSLKSILRKSPENLDNIGLGELCFAINNHDSQEGSGTNNEQKY